MTPERISIEGTDDADDQYRRVRSGCSILWSAMVSASRRTNAESMPVSSVLTATMIPWMRSVPWPESSTLPGSS